MKKFKSIFAKTILVGILIATAASCTSDDDDDMGTPAPAADISYKVQLTKIKATDTSGEGDANNTELEIFGELSTILSIGTTKDTRTLWAVEIEEALSVGQNDMQLTGSETFTISADDLAISSITCSGNLTENDGGGFTQRQGNESSTFSLASITGSQDFELTFSDPVGQTVVVTFVITRL